jgi:signal transduction histidine kinase
MAGMTIKRLDAPEKNNNYQPHLRELLENGAAIFESEHVTKEGKNFPVEIHARLISAENKQLIVSVIRDITERKKAEDKLRESESRAQEIVVNLEKLVEERTKQLREKERLAAIGATAGMVGHDIRNPLQAIINEIFTAKQIMADFPSNTSIEAALESINFIEEQTDYITKIVADLQDYARPLKPQPVEVNLKNIVNATIATSNIPKSVQTEIQVAESFCFTVDPALLRRVLANLVMNAIQAMPTDGKLTISSDVRESKVIISVADSGAGVSDDAKANLFKPFFTTKSRGQGLGLAVVKRLVESMNGAVSCDSQEGKGAKFSI